MAAKVLVGHLLRSEDFKQVEKSVIAFITSGKGEDTLDVDYMESVDAIVSYMLEKNMDTICETESMSIRMILQKIVTVVCLPLLRTPRPSTYDNDKGDKLKLFQLTYKVVSRITFGSSLEISQHIWSLLFKSLKNFVNECKHGFGEGHEVDANEDLLQVATALDLLGSLLEFMNKSVNDRLNYILEVVLDVLKVVRSGSLLFKITGKILPALLSMNGKDLYQNSEKIWETVKCLLLQERNENKDFTGFFGSYAVMSSLADVYFTLNTKPVFKVHHNPVFWTMLQRGLVNVDDPLVRKRCLYLVQKAVQLSNDAGEKVFVNKSSPVFWWDPDNTDALRKIWHQYVFILEILEEKQLHVIKPVLHRLDELIDAAKKTNDFQSPLLHVSWLTVIIHRGAIHENRFIKKWAIMSLLTLDLHEVPLLEDTLTRHFVSDTLIMLLKEPSLYAKNDGEGKGEPSKLTKELIGFFKKCFTILREDLQAAFFIQITSSIRQHNMSHVPLTFICHGLANLPRVPGVGTELLNNVRLILSNTSGHSVVMRGAVQSFMLRTVMNVMDQSLVHLDDVFAFLGLFVKEESLSRGISLWEEVGQWLSVNVDVCQRKTKDLFSFLDGKLRRFLKDSVSEKNCSQAIPLAKFLLLCCDSSVIDTNEMTQLFDVVFSSISKAQSNPYHPISSCWQAVGLLRALFYELRSIVPSEEVADNIVITLTNGLHEVLYGLMQYLQRTISQDNESVSFQGYRVCFELLDEVRSLWLMQRFPTDISRRYLALINKLVDLALRDLSGEALAKPTTTKIWLRLVISEKLIAWMLACADIPGLALAEEKRSRIFESVRSWNLANDLRYPNSNVPYSDAESLLKQDDWRVLVQDHVAVQWECVTEAVKEKPHAAYMKDRSTNSMCTLSGNTINDVVDVCVEALSLVSGQAFLPCLTALQLFLPQLITTGDESSSSRLLQTAWSVLMEIRTQFSAQFFPALDIVVRIVFATELLTLPEEHPLTFHVQKYWKSLLKIAHDQSGLVSVAVRHICKVFSGVSTPTLSDVRLRSLQDNVEVFADVCVFGPVHKKDLRLLFDTAAYIKGLGPHCGAVCLTKRKEFESETACVRVDVLAFLLSLEAREGSRAAPVFIGLIKALLERNRVLSEAKTSRFLNSENHRQKQRLWQTILVLVSCVGDDAFAAEFAPRVFEELQSDNQTSVRFLMEWTLVRVLSKHAGNMHLLWQQFENISRKRLGYVSSLISIAVHVLLTLEEDSKDQMDYLFRLLPVILPCAFLNHSQIRAYLLDALRLISNVFSGDVWARATERFPVVKSCLGFADCVFEGEKEKCRLLKDRSLFSLHPVRDFSIEAIFETVPSMAGVVEEEVIHPAVFQTEGSLPWTEAKVVPLYRRIADTENEKESIPCGPTLESNAAGQSLGTKNPTESSFAPAVSDVQKKITPWQVSAPPQEDLDAFDQLQQRPVQRRVGNLVVVASLIDRAPNLGGLCRTCEIFGASKLVLGSKHVVSETGFQSVSVSSEKWVEVEEVKVNDLVDYLSGMRKEGYTIVGVEQTAQSKKLTDFQFPCSTVLVLGNEKAGIPVELIQLLDECVEIPQYGIIRSLNVHVSGALFIWEYSRQHLNDN